MKFSFVRARDCEVQIKGYAFLCKLELTVEGLPCLDNGMIINLRDLDLLFDKVLLSPQNNPVFDKLVFLFKKMKEEVVLALPHGAQLKRICVLHDSIVWGMDQHNLYQSKTENRYSPLEKKILKREQIWISPFAEDLRFDLEPGGDSSDQRWVLLSEKTWSFDQKYSETTLIDNPYQKLRA